MFLASNLEKPKENQCFCSPRASGDPGGTIGAAHRHNLYTQTPDSPHLCGRLVQYEDVYTACNGGIYGRGNILCSYCGRNEEPIQIVSIHHLHPSSRMIAIHHHPSMFGS